MDSTTAIAKVVFVKEDRVALGTEITFAANDTITLAKDDSNSITFKYVSNAWVQQATTGTVANNAAIDNSKTVASIASGAVTASTAATKFENTTIKVTLSKAFVPDVVVSLVITGLA